MTKLNAGRALVWLLAMSLLIWQPQLANWPLTDRPEAVFSGSKTVQYSFTIQNRKAEPLPAGELALYAPVRETSNQRVIEIDASHPFEMESDELGNQVLWFRLADFGPFESRVVRVRVQLQTASTPNRVPIPDPSAFLMAERYVELDAPQLQRIAADLKRDTPLATARAIYDWIGRNIQSKEYIEDDRGALWAVRHREGDCTEFMYLYMALARLNGIPARGVGGYVLQSSAVLRPAGFHNWAEIYVDGAWHVVDAQERVFMTEQERYVALRILREASLSLLDTSHRFSFSGNGLSVAMN